MNKLVVSVIEAGWAERGGRETETLVLGSYGLVKKVVGTLYV